MASSETTATLNHSDSPHESHSPSRKRPLNGLTSLDPANHHTNGFIPLHSSNRETIDTPASTTPENGRRKRKKTRAFEIPGPTFVRRVSTGAMGVSGRGVKLSAIPNIVYAMEKRHAKSPEIEFLHRLLFNSAGTVLKRKSNIRAFSGFVFQSDKERCRVRDKLMRSHLNLLKRVAAVLDVQVKDQNEFKHSEDIPHRQNTEIEMAAEAFLGSDSLASEDAKGDINAEEVKAGQTRAESAKEISKAVVEVTNGKIGIPDTDSGHSLTKEPAHDVEGLVASGGEVGNEKAEKFKSRQRKEESARVTRQRTVQAILSFLEMPKIQEGRLNLAQREKERKRQKRALEKAKAQKALLKKAEEKRKELLAKSRARESDEDGDEDLEIEAKPWIVLARERQEREQRLVVDSEVDSHIAANGHE